MAFVTTINSLCHSKKFVFSRHKLIHNQIKFLPEM